MDNNNKNTSEDIKIYIDRVKKEIEENSRRRQKERYEELMEKLAKEQAKKEITPPEKQIGYVINKSTEERHARGEIVNSFIQQHLDGKIAIARLTLVLAMMATALFKGQWILWIIFIVIYKIYVTEERRKAFEEDVRRHNKK